MEDQAMNQLIAEADRLYTENRLEDALDLYTDVIQQDPTIAWAYSRIGAILAQTGKPESAEAALMKAVELDPTLPQAHSNLGNLHYAKGEYQEALTRYQNAALLDPNNPIFQENLHAAYKKLRKYSEAVSALKRAHKLAREAAKAGKRGETRVSSRYLPRGSGCLGRTLMIAIVLIVGLVLLL